MIFSGGGAWSQFRQAIPKHPIPMKTVFRNCFLVNFALQPEVLAALLPAPIVPDVFRGEAYLSVVIARLEKMRPAFLPRALGVTYNQVVYRAVVRCDGERGVHFLRSDANNWLMCLAGNLLTFFQFHYSLSAFGIRDAKIGFDLTAPAGHHADIHTLYDLGRASASMPSSSAFASRTEAQEFLVELYTAFAVDAKRQRVSLVRIERGEWDLTIVPDRKADYQCMQGGPLFPEGATRLDSIFHVRDLPYLWHTLEQRPIHPPQ